MCSLFSCCQLHETVPSSCSDTSPSRNFRKMASAKPSKQGKAKVESFVSALNKKGIKLLALDFDKTLIDIHSGGHWEDGSASLAAHVRPCMRDLLEFAAQKGLYVAIVTYHRQGWLIKEVLDKILPKKIANKIYVQANTTDFLQRTRLSSGSSSDGAGGRGLFGEMNGKEAHIAAVINDIYSDHNVTIKKDEIILMDDDMNNVRVAISFGHFAFQVQQNVDYPSFESFQTMLLL